MNNSRVAFNFLDKDDHAPVGYRGITCHPIFNFKMELARKSRYVSGGHITNPPLSITYVSLVSHDSVHLAFLIEALNDLISQKVNQERKIELSDKR